MTTVDITVSTPTSITSRVRQVAAIMDVPVAKKTSRTWRHEMPLDFNWNIGLIVGPSGAGKSLLARELWGDAATQSNEWSPTAALVDGFPKSMGVKDVTGLLSAVGLGDVPAWLRPYQTLSNGEAFRADVARRIASTPPELPVIVDEFTSVVDRQVAKVASHTVQKLIRREKRQFVAVTCHYDVTEWLRPDWIYDVAAGRFTKESVQPRHPPLTLDIHACSRTVWPMFAPHHYLSSDLASGAHCFAAHLPNGQPVAFTSYIHFPHPKTRNIKMAHRVVVLPDYQGLGIASHLSDWMGLWLFQRGLRYRYTVAHPAMIAMLAGSPRWRSTDVGAKKLATTTTNGSMRSRQLDPRRLSTRSFEYMAPAGTKWACVS